MKYPMTQEREDFLVKQYLEGKISLAKMILDGTPLDPDHDEPTPPRAGA